MVGMGNIHRADYESLQSWTTKEIGSAVMLLGGGSKDLIHSPSSVAEMIEIRKHSAITKTFESSGVFCVGGD